MCYYFDVIIKIEDFAFNNNLLDENLNENIFIYVLYKTFIGAKPLRFMFNEFIRDYSGTKYLALFGSEKYNAIFSRIRYLISL